MRNGSKQLTKEYLYGDPLKVSVKIRQRQLQASGQCVHHLKLEASKVVLWDPVYGDVRRGKVHHIYTDNLIADSGQECIQDIKVVMMKQELRQADFVAAAQVGTWA